MWSIDNETVVIDVDVLNRFYIQNSCLIIRTLFVSPDGPFIMLLELCQIVFELHRIIKLSIVAHTSVVEQSLILVLPSRRSGNKYLT